MTSERPYDSVGREPMDDEQLEAAIEAWRREHADDPLQAWGGEQRLRRLNAEAKQRAADKAEAAAAGTTEWAIRRARSEAAAAEAAAKRERQLAAARAAVGPKARRPGGPPPDELRLTVARIIAEIRAIGPDRATQAQVAERTGHSDRHVRGVLKAAGLNWRAVLELARL